MAKGDAAGAGPTAVADTANFDFQPAAGVEVMITSWSSGNTGSGFWVTFFDGTTQSNAVSDNNKVDAKMIVNNSVYFRITNNSGISQDLVARGIQTK